MTLVSSMPAQKRSKPLYHRAEQVEQRVQMLLGIFASHRVLPLEFKPAYSVGDLLLQHLDALAGFLGLPQHWSSPCNSLSTEPGQRHLKVRSRRR
jgi:hypothetical protein